MRALLFAAVFALALSTTSRPAHADPCTAELPRTAGAEFAGVVRYIGDGDSLCVGPEDGDGSTWIEVRLADFNAAELNAPGGRAARATLRRVAMNQPIECVATRGRNGRVVSWDRVIAVCRIGGRSVGELMHSAGVAEGGN